MSHSLMLEANRLSAYNRSATRGFEVGLMKAKYAAAVFAIASIATSSAMACDNNLLAVVDWSVEPAVPDFDPGFSKISVTYRFDGDAPIRMIDASIIFDDALGRMITLVPIDPDQTMSPGETLSASILSPNEYIKRLLTLRREDILACGHVIAVVYADGTVEKF